MLFPEAGTTNRMFTFNFWINIVETLLLQKKNAQIMVCGVTDFSEKLNEALIAKFGTTTITPFSKLSIPQIISTLKSSQGAITLDSFPAHLSASQTPTLCLFKEGTGSEYFPINAFSTYIIHNHQFSKNFYTFRSKMKIVYIDSFENQGFNDILTMAISTVFK
jgi:ADP-heptose:LPS heptosyltransferase